MQAGPASLLRPPQGSISTPVFPPTSTPLKDPDHDIFGGATVHEVLDDPVDTPDDDTTYVVDGNALDTVLTSRVGFASLPANVVSIEEVRVYMRARTTGDSAGAWTFGARVNGTTYYRDGSTAFDRFFSEIFSTPFYRYALSPDTGVKWTVAEFNALELELVSRPDALTLTGVHRFTQCWVEVDVVTEEVGRYSYVPWNSRSEGLFEASILSLKDASRSVLSEQNALEGSKCGMKFVDRDRTFSTKVASGQKIRNSIVTIRWASPDVPIADWLTTFEGVVTRWKETGTNVWDVEFDREGAALKGLAQKVKFTEADFQLAPDDKIFGNFAPAVWGSHKSTGLNDDGMIKLFRVSDVEFISSRGRIKGHNQVYTFESGDPPTVVPLTAITDWEEDFPIINGRQWTRVTLVGGGATANKEKEIRADVEGFEETGDGTGLLLTNPALIVLHWLLNFVFNNYQSGNWITAVTTEPIDVPRFIEARDFFNQSGQASSRYMGGTGSGSTAIQELQRFTDQMEIKVYWTRAGKLAIRPNSPFTLEVYPTENVIEEGLHDLIDPSYDVDDTGLLNEILMSYLHQQAENQFLANAQVTDIEIENAGDRNIQALWLPSSLPGEIEGVL